MLRKTKGLIFISISLVGLLAATFIFNKIDVWSDTVSADQYLNIGEDVGGRKIVKKADTKVDENVNFKASGDTELKVGANVRDNMLLNEKAIFKVSSSETADVFVYAKIAERGLNKIYFHFVDSYGFEQRSGEYTVPITADKFVIWSSFKIKRGSWKVSIKDVKTDVKLALKRFIVKSDIVKKILDDNKKGDDIDSISPQQKSKTYMKIGSHANRNYIKEASIITANKWGYGAIYVAAWIIESRPKRIYFYYENSEGVSKRSRMLNAGVNAKGYRLWWAQNLKKGKWKVQVKDASHTVLAEKSFIIR